MLLCCTALTAFLLCCMLLSVWFSLQKLWELYIPSSPKLNIMETLQALLPLRFQHIWSAARSLFFPSTGIISASAGIWTHAVTGPAWLKIASLSIMSAIHKSFHVYFGPMNLKYNWILKETFYFFEILTRNIPKKKKHKNIPPQTTRKQQQTTKTTCKMRWAKAKLSNKKHKNYCWAFTLKSWTTGNVMVWLKQGFQATARPGKCRRICQLVIDFYWDVKCSEMTAAHIWTQISSTSAENSSKEKCS